MKPTVFIFYSGDEFAGFPKVDTWGNWPPDIDTPRLAWACAESWRNNGWQPRYISCAACAPMGFTGRLAGPLTYPEPRWRLWAAFAEHFRLTGAVQAVFCTIDVFNRWLSPKDLPQQPVADGRFLTFSKHHVSLAAGIVTPGACDRLIDLVHRYDRGELGTVCCILPSDESILREKGAEMVDTLPIMGHAHHAPDDALPLTHFPRSELFTFRDGYRRDAFQPSNELSTGL